MNKWWESGDNVITLARWLNEHAYFDFGDPVAHVISLFEKPYKFSKEWNRMQDGGLEPDEERCPKCKQPGDAEWIEKYDMCCACAAVEEENEYFQDLSKQTGISVEELRAASVRQKEQN